MANKPFSDLSEIHSNIHTLQAGKYFASTLIHTSVDFVPLRVQNNINITMLKGSRKALSLDLLNKHQQRIKGMISRIENYKPVFQLNKEYTRKKKIYLEKREEQREDQSDRLFQQNLKLITRIESTGSKIETKKFPKVNPNPTRLKSLSLRSHSRYASNPKFHTKDVFRNEDELFNENLKIITAIESTGPKITCWTSKKTQQLMGMATQRKQEEKSRILDKYREISREFTRLARMRSFKGSPSNTSAKSRSVLS